MIHSSNVDLTLIGMIGGVLVSISGGGVGMLVFFMMTAFYWVEDQVSITTATAVLGVVTPVSALARQVSGSAVVPELNEIWEVAAPLVIVTSVVGVYLQQNLRAGVLRYVMYTGVAIEFGWGLALFGSSSTFFLFLQCVVFAVFASITTVIGVGGAIMNFKNSKEKKDDE